MADSDIHPVAPDLPPLRVAAVVPAGTIPAWVARVLEDSVKTSGCHLVGALAARAAGLTPSGHGSAMPTRAYERLDSRLFRADPDAFAPSTPPPGVPVEDTDVQIAGGRTELGPRAVAWLLSERTDVVVGLGVPHLHPVTPSDISVWTLEVGGRPLASWTDGAAPELIARRHLIVITVRESGPTPRLPGQTRRTVTSVIPWSPALTRNKVMWSAANLMVHALSHARRGVPASASTNLALDRSDSFGAAPLRVPEFAFPFRQTVRLAAHAVVRSVTRDEWHVAYRMRDGHERFGDGSGFRVLKAPPGHSYADPLMFEDGGRHWMFLEDLVYAKRRARIVCFELTEDGTDPDTIPVLEEDHHLSYPFVFKRGPDIFMIPESGQTNSLELYRALSFPRRWERLGPILSGLWCSDATVIDHRGLLWMFVTIARPGMHPSDELHLYFATDLLGPWEPHRMNPIVADVRAGRAAGALFWQDEVLIRPAQDSARRYGHAINFQAVRVLSEEDYREETVGRLSAHQLGGKATHTYNFDSRYEVVDLLKPRSRWHR